MIDFRFNFHSILYSETIYQKGIAENLYGNIIITSNDNDSVTGIQALSDEQLNWLRSNLKLEYSTIHRGYIFSFCFMSEVLISPKGELDRFKEKNEDEYTHLLQSVWRGSGYERLRELSQVEFKNYNERAKFIESRDEVE